MDIVKAETDFANVLGWVGGRSEANQWVHLAHEALFGIVSQSEPYPAVPHPCLEVVELEQGLPIHVGIDATIAIAISAGNNLNTLQKVIEFCWPFNDGGLAQWHRCAGV
ncbi:hypothetical protein IC232_22560 [Microvirga sp. BT688]|uniref:hypothetical protein n=1 Tax=Microvirga sp. TaxID=1873136 RepID=UPI0016841B27|nr:hypothetical protein [Microvirga sp.]MBD2749466.1 hypothetical protein [Microvirga sp.]